MPTLKGFYPYGDEDGAIKQELVKIAASSALSQGAPMKRVASSDTFAAAASNDNVDYIYNDKPIASTDSDYASTKMRMCIKVYDDSQFKCQAISGTFVSTNTTCDLTSSGTSFGAAASTQSNNDLYVEKVLSTTQAIVRFKKRNV